MNIINWLAQAKFNTCIIKAQNSKTAKNIPENNNCHFKIIYIIQKVKRAMHSNNIIIIDVIS